MKAAVIQTNAGTDKAKNIARALSFVNKASRRGAKFILLPEAFNYRGRIPKKQGAKPLAENIPGESTRPFQKIAREKKIFILLGSLCEKNKNRKPYNTSALIDDHGKIAARYRKVHLFKATVGKKKLDESRYLSAGKSLKTAGVGKFKAGLNVCYDVRFPKMFREYSRRGAEVLCVPAVFTRETGRAHFEVLLRARAIENLCYVLAPNQVGKDGKGVLAYGNSMIIDPWGKVIARASGNKEEIIYGEIRKDVIKKCRTKLPNVNIKKHKTRNPKH